MVVAVESVSEIVNSVGIAAVGISDVVVIAVDDVVCTCVSVVAVDNSPPPVVDVVGMVVLCVSAWLSVIPSVVVVVPESPICPLD